MDVSSSTFRPLKTHQASKLVREILDTGIRASNLRILEHNDCDLDGATVMKCDNYNNNGIAVLALASPSFCATVTRSSRKWASSAVGSDKEKKVKTKRKDGNHRVSQNGGAVFRVVSPYFRKKEEGKVGSYIPTGKKDDGRKRKPKQRRDTKGSCIVERRAEPTGPARVSPYFEKAKALSPTFYKYCDRIEKGKQVINEKISLRSLALGASLQEIDCKTNGECEEQQQDLEEKRMLQNIPSLICDANERITSRYFVSNTLSNDKKFEKMRKMKLEDESYGQIETNKFCAESLHSVSPSLPTLEADDCENGKHETVEEETVKNAETKIKKRKKAKCVEEQELEAEALKKRKKKMMCGDENCLEYFVFASPSSNASTVMKKPKKIKTGDLGNSTRVVSPYFMTSRLDDNGSINIESLKDEAEKKMKGAGRRRMKNTCDEDQKKGKMKNKKRAHAELHCQEDKCESANSLLVPSPATGLEDVANHVVCTETKKVSPYFADNKSGVEHSNLDEIFSEFAYKGGSGMNGEINNSLRTQEGRKKERRKIARPTLSAAEKLAEAYQRKAPDNTWVPPRSHYNLLQEDHVHDPWRVLVICILLNITSGPQVKSALQNLFSLCPNAEAAIAANPTEIQGLIQSLGLQRKRAIMIQRFSMEYLSDEWTHVTQLHGIGKYAADAYAIFCTGMWREVEPADYMLNFYWKFLHMRAIEANR